MPALWGESQMVDVSLTQLTSTGKVVGQVIAPNAGVEDWMSKAEKMLGLFNKTVENVMRLQGKMPNEQAPQAQAPRVTDTTFRPAVSNPPEAARPEAFNPKEALRPIISKVIAGCLAYESGLTGGKPTDNVVDAVRSMGLTVEQVRKMLEKFNAP